MAASLPEPVFEVTRGIFSVKLMNGMEIPAEEIDRKDIFNAVFQYCSTPRTRAEITAFTGKSRYYTMSAIVQPLIEQGRIQLTIPDKPQSPKQQYVAVHWYIVALLLHSKQQESSEKLIVFTNFSIIGLPLEWQSKTEAVIPKGSFFDAA